MQQTATTPEALLDLQQAIVDRIAAQEELLPILDELCRLVEALRPGAICSLMRLDPETGSLFVDSAPCAPPELVEELDGLVPGELAGSCGTSVYTGEMVIVEDTLTDRRWAPMRGMAERFGIRSCWSIPIRAGRSRIVGSFAISTTTRGAPSPEELRLLETAAHLSAIAIVHNEANAGIRHHQRLLQGILEGIEDPIFVKDDQLKYILANSAEMHGVVDSAQEFIGADDYDLYPHETAERTRGIDRSVLARGDSQHYEQTFDNPLAGRRTFLVRKSPLRGEEGETIGVIGVARDITELRRAEQAVLQSQKLESLGVLAGGIAHDFNNILTAILGEAECALAEPGSSESVRGGLQVIQRAAQRAADLTHQMLSYAGKADVDKRVIALPDLLDEVLELVNSSVSRQAQLSIRIEDELPSIHADPAQLRQLLMNLITNASEALNDGAGKIEITMSTVARPLEQGQKIVTGRFVHISVVDDGIGMDADTIARIFDPFFTTKFDGRGLGLAAVQGIVRGHHGTIQVSSEFGRGTTFNVVLPASEISAERVADAEPLPEWSGKGTVLVVEDEESILALVAKTLEAAGLKVLRAVDGARALELFEAQRDEVDLVLLDWTTAQLSGSEVLAGLRRLRRDVRVVLSSGYPENCVTAGLEPETWLGFLKKPYSPAELMGHVRSALETSV